MAELVYKEVNGMINVEEREELNAIIERSESKKELYKELTDSKRTADALLLMLEFNVDASWEKVKNMWR
jgi:hypothetical protein